VKKLRWKPDIVHCQGWISHFLPVYLKKVYHDDPIFTDAKVVVSLYNEMLDSRLSDNVVDKVVTGSLVADDVAVLNDPAGINLAKLAIQYADGVIAGVPEPDARLMDAARQQGLPVLPYVPVSKEGGPYVQAYDHFYDDLLKDKR
jgi:starch synthase